VGLFDELKRRKVFRVAAVYAATAFVVLQAVDLMVEALGAPGWLLTASAVAAIVGFPVALVTGWAFELSEKGVRRTDDVPDDASETSGASPALFGPKTLALVAGLLVLGIGMGAGWFLGSDASRSSDADGAPSIAVLPFENSSPDPEDEYLSDGIAEEIIVALRRVPGVDVAARTSSWQFKGTNPSPRQVADSIGVSSVVAGTVRRSGGDVRITVELISADGRPLWSDQYEVMVDDLFATQDRISESIANALQIRFTADERAAGDDGETDPAAYDHYLRGRYNLALRSLSGFYEAIDDFGAAVAIDSTLALGWAGLGEAWMLGMAWELPEPASEMYAASVQALERAVALDPDLAQAHAATGLLMFWVGRWDEAEVPLLRALEINPEHADALQWLGHLYSRLGRYDEAEASIEQALRQEPFSRGVASGASSTYEIFRPEEAISYGYRLIELGHTQSGLLAVWRGLVHEGRLDEALPHAREWVRGLGGSEQEADDREAFMVRMFDAFREYQETGEQVEVPRGPLTSFAVDAQLLGGRADVAFEMLDRLFANDDPALLTMIQRRSLHELRDDPRYLDLRRRMRERFGG